MNRELRAECRTWWRVDRFDHKPEPRLVYKVANGWVTWPDGRREKFHGDGWFASEREAWAAISEHARHEAERYEAKAVAARKRAADAERMLNSSKPGPAERRRRRP